MRNKFDNQTILVTGGLGFIGSHLVHSLVQDAAEVHVLAKPKSDPWRLGDIAGKVRIHPCDITDRSMVKALVQEIRPKKLFHLASEVDVRRKAELVRSMYRVILDGTLNLLESVQGTDLDCFIHAGTCEEYGNGPAPFQESQRENPVSPYSAAKVAATHLCETVHKSYGVPIVMLRPFLTYGPGQMGWMLVPSMTEACLLGKSFRMMPGEQTRDFIYVQDIVDGFLAAASNPSAIGQIINLSSGKETSIKEMATCILEVTQSKVPLEFGALSYRSNEIMRLVGSGEKARRILGWEPKMDLKEGLRRTVAWYSDYLSCKVASHAG